MKKKGHERKQVEEHVQLDWVELSEKLNAKDGSAGMLDKMRFERDTNEPEPGAIVNETISQIVSEEYLKVNTEDTVKDTSKDPGDPFYAYDKKRAKKKKEIAASKAAAKPKSASSLKTGTGSKSTASSKTGTGSKSAASSKTGTKPKKSVKTRSDEDRDEAIRKSVDEKIIIRSEELKKKRRSAGKSKAEKAQSAPEKTSAVKEGVNTIRPEEAFRHTKGLEKFRKMGVLPTKGEGPSEFRKASANWQYDNIPANIAEGLSDISSESDGDEEGKKGFSPMWWCGAVITAVILISSILATSVYADYRGEINKENAMANLPVFEDDASSIAYTGDKLETDEIELEEAASPIESAEGKMLSLVLTSVEKDLKVKLVDEEDTLVKG
ncbi:MAG: hypothetical protein IKQ40_04650, partial [Lachnospiraceae bacterium]|nr:hypothetical protein [Lachnospiraceae bacterium]